ncbi:MAG TPA: AMP-binding protein [Aliidongia sp.]|uniref:AMP-dependent synthetase/ligase n=1 Tax=Aliidongia sp. TaxID=1914230 RepID=UPI002DDCE7D7|nr:AMP-binding protein [Aliidongia sp.]HEV2677542.1 AMP-binding protein [Aliidongia sp.]
MTPALDPAILATLPMPRVLQARAAADPTALAMREKVRGVWHRTSWGEYHATVRCFAIGLHALGFRPGDRLAVAGENSPQWIFADLAAQWLGGACLGIYPTNPWPELRYILAHSRAKFVVAGDQEQTDKIIEARRQGDGLPDLAKTITVDMKGMRSYDRADLLSFDDVLALGREAEARLGATVDALLDALDPDAVALIVYTSGTTGMPKGAMLSHRNMLSSAAAVVGTMGLSASTYSVVCYLPLCHVAERSFSTCMQLLSGAVVNFAESIDTIVINLREIAPKGFLGVPRIWEKMQQSILFRLRDTTPLQRRVYERAMALGRPIAERAMATGGHRAGWRDRILFRLLWLVCFRSLQRFLGLDRVRACYCGGASVSPEVLLFFRTLGIPIYQIYGMTESAGVSHLQQPGFTQAGCAGRAIAGLEQQLAPDGELLIRGPTVFKGYLFDADATARALDDGWLHTGDIVEIEPNGEIRIADRKKDIIITSGGKNITPSLIENALKDSLYIREAVLLGDGRHFLSALIQIEYDTVGKWAQDHNLPYTTYQNLATLPEVFALVEAEVAAVNARFARVENIRKFVILEKQLDHDDGELTATMKVRRKAIEQRFHQEIGRIYGSAA